MNAKPYPATRGSMPAGRSRCPLLRRDTRMLLRASIGGGLKAVPLRRHNAPNQSIPRAYRSGTAKVSAALLVCILEQQGNMSAVPHRRAARPPLLHRAPPDPPVEEFLCLLGEQGIRQLTDTRMV